MTLQTDKILLVDDDREILDVLKMRLELMDFQVTACNDPEVALEQFDDHDLVLTDQRMDKLKGIDLLHKIKEKAPDIPVIIMTAFGTVDDAVNAVKSGAFSYIEKPVDPFRLSDLIKTAIEHRRLQQQLAIERELLGNAVSAIGASLFLTSYDGDLLWTNSNAKNWLMEGDSVSPRIWNLLTAMSDDAKRTGEHKATEFLIEDESYREGDGGRWYLLSVTPNPRLEYIAVLAIDITEIKEAQKSLADKERLEGALEMAGTIAHQFSQPMQALVLHCDLLSREDLSAQKRKEIIRSMTEQVERLGQLIHEITGITRYATMDYPGSIRILDLENALKQGVVKQKGLPGLKKQAQE